MNELTAGNVKAAMKEAGAVSADLWQVAPDKLRVLEGFNARERTAAYAERVRWIADRIKANGYDKTCPLAGFVAVEDGQQVIYVTGGHRRLEAVRAVMLEGVDVPVVPVIISPRGTSMEDLTVALVTENEGQPLTTYENAAVCKRLASFGWESGEIARRLGYSSAQYVDGLLSLAGAPIALRRMVIEGAVSATVAIATLAKHGDKAVDVLVASLGGGTKVKPKDLPAQQYKRKLVKAAPTMLSMLKALVDKGPTTDTFEEIKEFLKGME